ncbi:MAG: bifunctional glutamate N-acetyltransferase/amino-acid acetyltransferase ArgJ [Christensenellaceae bacterium]|jgi:glutamate N-acetyltransferase/amino-acid N-acetyltransferase|nr:bifunctional glutamate N-acetyltransferase/amino-acid acetyltransferase ArgJ [Christensenellaceae bacterium]
MDRIQGGVCAAQGFTASGVHCGIRKNKVKKDLALILSDRPASAACVYTTNLVQGAPIAVTQAHIQNGVARAVLCNSGYANTCNADGVEVAEAMCGLLADAAGISAQDVIIASTGVIGQPLPLGPIAAGMGPLFAALGDNSEDAAVAILTTDTRKKEVAVAFTAGGKACHMGGIAKGSGMIHPNMATMLVFITTDAAITPALLHRALQENVKDTFNMVSIDGDTSTNDMVSVLANGAAGNAPIAEVGADYLAFCEALHAITEYLCREIARDGEGATKLIECRVEGARDAASAKLAAKSVICSNLVKAAMFGADANWGRVLCAIGYSGADVDVHKVDVRFVSKAGSVEVCRQGAGVEFSEELAKAVLSQGEIEVRIALHSGAASATAWGCDLTYDYVKINGDYRT